MTDLVDFARYAAFFRVLAAATKDPRERAEYLANAVACAHYPERLPKPVTLPPVYQPNLLAGLR